MRSPKNSCSLPNDKLFHVERTIARRADELILRNGTDRDHALDCWHQAEREFWQMTDVAAATVATPSI